MKHFLFVLFALPLVLVGCNPEEEGDELLGCMDPDAVNFNANATVDDGSCVTALNPCSDGLTSVFFDGYSYNLVGIGDQCWFAENLRNEHYANGDLIPGELSASEWSNANDTNLGAQAIYTDPWTSEGYSLANYARLYNWYAVNDERGLCPTGWHVPTDGEWMTLEMELGMSESEANDTSFRGTDQGGQMSSSPEDNPSWDGTNTSGFSGMPGGLRAPSGYCNDGGIGGLFWSSSPNGSDAWFRYLLTLRVYRNSDNGQGSGFSVRCVRD
jgi:uncharacterized protein (TIGR02145 family)